MAQSKDVRQAQEAENEVVNLQNPQQMASEMARAFQELQKGEQTASALEKQLDGIESRIEELLAAAEASANGAETEAAKDNNLCNTQSKD